MLITRTLSNGEVSTLTVSTKWDVDKEAMVAVSSDKVECITYLNIQGVIALREALTALIGDAVGNPDATYTIG